MLFNKISLRTMLIVMALVVSVATACSSDDTDPAALPEDTTGSEDGAGTSRDGADRPIGEYCKAPSLDSENGLTSAGEALFDSYSSSSGVPVYQIDADIDPESGLVDGRLRATIPDRGDELEFRMFPGLEEFDSSLEIDDVTVDGDAVAFELDSALLTVPAPGDRDDDGPATVELTFAYTLQESAAADADIFAALDGESLDPARVGLLGRTSGGAQLGHWFPVWLPDSSRSDADPEGFGDIGAFPAASICASLTIPDGYELISGGTRLAVDDGEIVEGALGLRDLALLITSDLEAIEGEVDGVTVRVWGPTDDATESGDVLDETLVSQQALVDAFGPYPWEEIDVVSAPLGSGVGGMEWPGMVWIERTIFAGGIPGLGDLVEGFGEGPFADLLDEFLEDFGGPALATTREWTVAHELGHEWWHALVGNDSIASPAVDEPLAQFSACIAMRELHPDDWRDICEAQTIDTYAQGRALGIEDAPAEQASDEFDSALQYGAVVYGKAPGFYFEAAELIGWDALVDALEEFAADHPFELVGTDALRDHLVDAAGSDGGAMAELWDRWFREARGDEDIDIESADPLAGFGDLDDFGDLGDLLGEDGLPNIEDLLDEFGADPLGSGDPSSDGG